ncbi:MAG: flavohemoglobin expression-modulating QEGLA motif protein [Planctomycetota bacterium]|jgi:uncharacterized protein (TIGR02421 family)
MVKEKPSYISRHLIEEVSARLAGNKQVRRSLPEWGRLHIDRQLPFLCIYRKRKNYHALKTERLIMGEASYLTVPDKRVFQNDLSSLVKNVAGTLGELFGSFLIIEIWEQAKKDFSAEEFKPLFRIHCQKKHANTSTVSVLDRFLKKIKIRNIHADAEVVKTARINPPGTSPFLSAAEAEKYGCKIIGIEINPVYVDRESGNFFPVIFRQLHRGFSKVLKRCFFDFTNNKTTHIPEHYQSLGRRSMVKAVWEIDSRLSEISSSFDFILQVTPINSHAAWSAFKRSKFQKKPDFIYRPLPVDPGLAKRKLYKIPLEKIEDPTLAQLFRQQQQEIDRKLTLLSDLNTPAFKYGSQQLYGNIDISLIESAEKILSSIPPRCRESLKGGYVSAKDIAVYAEKEVNHFRRIMPHISVDISVQDDISGILVSHGRLLIGSHNKITSERVEALIQHEVGTHILTYLNGWSQPFKQLYGGLSGYEELQEGIAVLAEYMVDGLTRPRLRILAGRVIAVCKMLDGYSFPEVFEELNMKYGFERHTAFNIVLRVFRGGGLTKDAVYLRGLIRLLEYMSNGGDLEFLLSGKIAVKHIPIIRELQWRKILHPAPLKPRYLESPEAAGKLKMLSKGLEPLDLLKRKNK